jgi:hypothetical protein
MLLVSMYEQQIQWNPVHHACMATTVLSWANDTEIGEGSYHQDELHSVRVGMPR